MIRILLVLLSLAIAAESVEYVPQIFESTARQAKKPFRLGQHGDDIIVSRNRNAIKGKEMLWPGGVIPYTFLTKYPKTHVDIINGAMKAIQDNTCITFKPRTNEKHYVAIAAHPSGSACSSNVGTINNGEQVLYLSDSAGGTCIAHEIVIHELMHAIGLDHEHNRADRDKFVRINEKNVDPEMKHNFDTVDPLNFFDYGCPYTYESVMHYDKTSFGKVDGQVTMEPMDKKFADIIGKVTKAHPTDYEKINRIYKCSKKVAGHTCSATIPAAPCADDPAAPCAQVKSKGCEKDPVAASWIVKCRKSCNACVS